MDRSIKILLIMIFLACANFAQTTNKIVYEGWLDSLVNVSPYKDSLTALILETAGASDSSHFVAYNNVLGLSDTLAGKQDTLSSGVNIKTINSTSLLGSGDIAISGDAWTTIFKTSNDTIQSDNTLSYDNTCYFTTTANKDYVIEYYFYSSSTAAADFQHSFDHAGTTTNAYWESLRRSKIGSTIASSNAVGDAMGTSQTATGTSDMVMHVRGTCILEVGASGGTCGFQWAQNTSNASNTIVYKGAYIRYKVLN